MTAPRILIVDDQRDITRMLRAALETLGRGYVIVDVPSAEEAQLEFRRGPVDLLITDLRLPGISGLELIQRLHKASSEARMIVISAYADETSQAEFKRLGATFFSKPLDLHDFLASVQAILGSRAAETIGAARPPEEPRDMAARMARLRRDLGALAVLLVDLRHNVTEQSGEVPSLDVAGLLPALMSAFHASLQVSTALGGRVPANFGFFDGSAYDIYTANVGLAYALVIVFDSEGGVAQTGPVLRYARQCADDLLNILRDMGREAGPPRAAASASAATTRRLPQQAARPARTSPLRLRREAPPPEAAPAPQPAAQTARLQTPKDLAGTKAAAGPPLTPEEIAALEAAAGQVTSQAADAFWAESGENVAAPDERAGMITYEQAAELGLLPPKS